MLNQSEKEKRKALVAQLEEKKKARELLVRQKEEQKALEKQQKESQDALEKQREEMERQAVLSRKRKLVAKRPAAEEEEVEERYSIHDYEEQQHHSRSQSITTALPASYYVDDEGNIKPVRRVPREREGNYIVKMPVAKRETGQPIMRSQSLGSVGGGVFSRLGGLDAPETKKKPSKVRIVNKDDVSVFARVGGGGGNNNNSSSNRTVTISSSNNSTQFGGSKNKTNSGKSVFNRLA